MSRQRPPRTALRLSTVPPAHALTLRRGVRAARMADRYGQPVMLTRRRWHAGQHRLARLRVVHRGGVLDVAPYDRWWERPTNPATATYSLGHGTHDRT